MSDRNVSLWQLFAVFAKIGAFTIGGGYAMVLIIREEVEKRGWLSEDEFPDILAIAQSAPGLLAVNISIFAGYRIRGVKGSIVATLGSCLPSFLIILAIAAFFAGYQNNPLIISMFKAVRPAVVALIAVPMVRMASESNHTWMAWVNTVLVMVFVAFVKVSPIYILLLSVVVSYLLSARAGRRGSDR